MPRTKNKASHGLKTIKPKAPSIRKSKKPSKPKKPSITQTRLKEQEKEIKRIRRWLDKQTSLGYEFNDKAKKIIEPKKRPTAKTIETLKTIKGSNLRKTFFPHALFLTDSFSLVPAEEHYKEERSKAAKRAAESRKRKKEKVQVDYAPIKEKSIEDYFNDKEDLSTELETVAKIGGIAQNHVLNILSGINEYTTSLPFMNELFKYLNGVAESQGYNVAYSKIQGLDEMILFSDYMNPWEEKKALIKFLKSAVDIGLISQSNYSTAEAQIEAHYVDAYRERDIRNRKNKKFDGF